MEDVKLFLICYPLFWYYRNQFTLYPCISIVSCYHIFLLEFVKQHRIWSMSSRCCLTTGHALVILEKTYGVWPGHLYFTSWSSSQWAANQFEILLGQSLCVLILYKEKTTKLNLRRGFQKTFNKWPTCCCSSEKVISDMLLI